MSAEQDLVRVVVTASHKHAGQWRYIGQEYQTTELEARDLVAVGVAVRARLPAQSSEPPAKPRTYKRRDMRPEDHDKD